MARFQLKGKVVRFEKKSDKKLAMVIMKDSENQRHIPVWTPILSDEVSFFEFLEAWENKTLVQVEGLWVNRNWCGKSSPFCQLVVVLQVVMPILNIDIFLPFLPLLNR